MAKRALIVLNEIEPARLLRERLESLGFKVVHHRSAFEAVNELYGTQMAWILLGLGVFDKASRPQLLNPELWASNRHTPVVLVSDEEPMELRRFFAQGPMRLAGILGPPSRDQAPWVTRALEMLEGPSDALSTTTAETAQGAGALGLPASRASEARGLRPVAPGSQPPPPPRGAKPGVMTAAGSAEVRIHSAGTKRGAADEGGPANDQAAEAEPEFSSPFGWDVGSGRKPSAANRVRRAAAAAAAAASTMTASMRAAVSSTTAVLAVEEKRRIESRIQLLDDGDMYRILEIPPAATDRQVKGAYFRLVKQFHPDRYFGRLDDEWTKHVTRLFRGITRAYQTLLDPKSRERYDASYRPVAEIVIEAVEAVSVEEEVIEVEPIEIPQPAPEVEAEDVPLTPEELEEFMRREAEWIHERDSQAAARAEALYERAAEVAENPEAEELPLAPIREAYKVLTEAVSLMPENQQFSDAHEKLRKLYQSKRAYYHYRRGQERVAEGQLQMGYQDLKDAVLFDPRTEYILALVQTMLQDGSTWRARRS